MVFVGSSSIRLWKDLEQQFDASQMIVKRGFGGSRMSDCANYVGRLVVPYKPHLVVVYAGDNDLAEGRSPQEVLASFRRFVAGVRKALPETRIAYLSIKPSPRRAGADAGDARDQCADRAVQQVAAEPRLHRRLLEDARRRGPAARASCIAPTRCI